VTRIQLAKVLALTFVVVFVAVFAAFKFQRAMDLSRPLLTSASDSDSTKGVYAGFQDKLPNPSADFSEAAKRIMESVVRIDTVVQVRSFFGAVQEQEGGGSGVIISDDGYILTNSHVLENTSQITVQLHDGRAFPARVIGTDVRSDLALIKTEAKGLVPAVTGDSQNLSVGEWVMAVGSPLGFSSTLSVGVISSLGRNIPLERTLLLDTIQTDASINQGNSGGALCNAQGELIGINAAIVTLNEGSMGLAFAIPIHRAERIVEELRANGRVAYGGIGIKPYFFRTAGLASRRTRDLLQQEVGATSGPPSQGIVIETVYPNSAAQRAGIKPLDIITSIDDERIHQNMDYSRLMIDRRPGEKVKLSVWSVGQDREIELTLDEAI
jgi:S1-C subfamily serine protease